MTTYARIQNGIVVELTVPPAGRAIANMFHPGLQWIACDGTPGVTAGWTYTGGVLAAPAAPAALTVRQQATAALAGSATVTSAATPAISGTYPVGPITQGRLAAVSVYILVNGKFPGGVAAYPWLDTAGTPHVFPSTALFQAFASAIADYVSALTFIEAAGTGTLPAASIALT